MHRYIAIILFYIIIFFLGTSIIVLEKNRIEYFLNFNKIRDKKVREYMSSSTDIKSILGHIASDAANGILPSYFQ